LTLAKFRCAPGSSGDHFGYFEKHSCSVHCCLMNLVMISQTAQCWNTDGVSSSLRSEKEIFRSTSITGSGLCLTLEDERLTVFVCYHHAVRSFELILDA
jgi:hypothetical protein